MEPVHGNPTQSEVEAMKSSVQAGRTFRTQIEIIHPDLRLMMGLREGHEEFHDVQISLTRDPVTLVQVIS
jgi:hypothetical protein